MEAGSRTPAFVWDEVGPIGEVSLSPDASQLVFDASEKGAGFWGTNLFTVNVDGTGLAQLTDLGDGEMPTRAAWSPRGDLLAYGSYVGRGADEHAAVTIVEPDGAGARVLYSTPEPETRLTGVAWSPLGRDIVYTNSRNGVGAPMMLHRITAEQGKLVTGLGGFGTVWSPDGAYLAFMSGVGDPDHWGIYIVRAAPREDPRLVAKTPYPNSALSLAWVDNQHIAYLSADDERLIHIMDINGVPQEPLDVGATRRIQAFDWVGPARDVRPAGKLATTLGRLKTSEGLE